jgi:hypothetical protein
VARTEAGTGYRGRVIAAIAVLRLLGGCVHPGRPPAGPLPQVAPMSEAQRARSDAFAAELTAVLDALDPERTVDWSPGADERAIAALQAVCARLRAAREGEADPAVAEDLAILVGAAEQEIAARALDRVRVPLLDPASVAADGVSAALAAGGPDAALARLRRYTGEADGTEPLAALAEARTREALARPGAVPPARDAVERLVGFAVATELRAALADVPTAAASLDRLEAQLSRYDAFLSAEVLLGARADGRLGEDAYRLALRRWGIDADPVALADEAHRAFDAIVAEMQPIAAEVAADRGWPDPDYRAVLRELKREQIGGDALEALYRQRIADIDALIAEHAIVTLPARSLSFRLASAAESARMPAPMYLPPPPDHPDEPGTFVLPLRDMAAGGPAYDDFSFAAASWWLTAHEGRPGHDLQYATMAEHPPSVARARYAFVSANVEGWGLYAESLIAPYVDAEARLVILDARLMRAAHAFLDIELNLGRIGPDEVRRVMVDEVGFSPAWAETCLLRYTTLMPGQAPSYFYGYQRLVALRDEARDRFGDRFDLRAFHDAVLAQGVVPPDQLRAAVLGPVSPRAR